MPTLYIPIGIPGCGKSTWSREAPRRDAETVSSDTIRKELFPSLIAANDPAVARANNRRVFDIYHERIASALVRGDDVIADATNLDSRSRRQLYDIAQRHGAKVHYVVFLNTPQALKQNRQRDADAIVPDDVMDKMINKLLIANVAIVAEDYDSIEVITQVG